MEIVRYIFGIFVLWDIIMQLLNHIYEKSLQSEKALKILSEKIRT